MSKVLIIMGSGSDLPYCEEISIALDELKLPHSLRVASAHKTPEEALKIVREAADKFKVIITVAGLSDSLSGFAAANTTLPVIAAPPLSKNFSGMDILSSLSMPRGVAPMTVLGASQAALAAAKIIALSDKNIEITLEKSLETSALRVRDMDEKVRDGKRKKT
ncbi:MAG: AIR carboxylase family protein [Elusimicrobia bacterium]|nr:AIR carboxylase family protein [Elusimicrobiota bacterium]